MQLLDWYHSPIRILERGSGINKTSFGMRNKLLCIESGVNSCTNASQKIRKILINLFMTKIQSDCYLVLKKTETQMLLDDWKNFI